MSGKYVYVLIWDLGDDYSPPELAFDSEDHAIATLEFGRQNGEKPLLFKLPVFPLRGHAEEIDPEPARVVEVLKRLSDRPVLQ